MNELVEKVRAKALLWSGRNAIVGTLEQPHPPDPHAYTGWIDVRGWALGLDGTSPLTILCLIDDKVVQRVTPDFPRADIAALFPAFPAAARCGFEMRLALDVLPWQGASVLTVKAMSDTPRRGETTLGVVPIRRQDTVVARAAYGQVWNAPSVSGSVVSARTSVAGTADPQEYERSGEATAGDIVEHAQVTSTDTVLEIGCGTGRIGVKLAPRCGHWIGADVSTNMLGHAREALHDVVQAGAHVSFLPLNGVDLAGVDTATIDVAYCSGVFMHLDEWDRYRYVTEARRVLKPGGRLYFDNFNLRSEEGWRLFEDLYRMEPAARPPNISRSSTPEELLTYGERAGFEDLRVLTRGLWVTVIGRAPRA
jgi:ubiquinone/menaquinone biosynthesis C-methylase UbiE